tara:strand:+ start:2314 stop:2655 length:342 start_codon:yes stop_codon:yes gene_type:complete
MPVLKKEIELNDGTRIWVKQASGMSKLKITNLQAQAFRKMRHAGEPSEWTDEQNEEFAAMLDDLGAGMTSQVESWVPNCILDENIDVDNLTMDELNSVLLFVRGDDDEGAVPL